MRFRTTLILAVAVLLGAGYYAYDARESTRREAAEQAERRVVAFAPEDVREVAVDKPGERVLLRGDGGRWRIAVPEDAAADAPTVEGLLAFIRRLDKIRTVGRVAADLGDFGLAPPAARLTLGLRDGRRLTLLVGRPNPESTGVYAKLEGGTLLFLAPFELGKELARTPYVDEVRDRRILPFEAAAVRRLEIERAGVRIAVTQTGLHQWRVERPFVAAGDDGILGDLLWKIGQARAVAVIPGPVVAARYGLDRPHARARLFDAHGKALTLAVVQDREGRVYAAIDGVPAVYVIDGQLLADLAIAPESLRNRQLLVHDPGEVERITIRYPGDTLVLERSETGWRVTSPVQGEAASAVVANLLEVLPNVRYHSVAATNGRDLGAYGLDRPRLVVTVDLKGGRRLPVLSVGGEDGEDDFVMVAGSPAVYKVDSRLFRVIPEEPADAVHYPLPELLKRAYDKQGHARKSRDQPMSGDQRRSKGGRPGEVFSPHCTDTLLAELEQGHG